MGIRLTPAFGSWRQPCHPNVDDDCAVSFALTAVLSLPPPGSWPRAATQAETPITFD